MTGAERGAASLLEVGMSDTEPPVPSHDPWAEPDEAFWVQRLLFARFKAVLSSLDSKQQRFMEKGKRWSSTMNKQVLDAEFPEHEDSSELAANLVVLAEFIRHIKVDAIVDVAREVAPDHEALAKRSHSRSCALLIYAREPGRLLDVLLLDGWRKRARGTLRVEEEAPEADLLKLPWEELVEPVLESFRPRGLDLLLHSVIRRRVESDVLLVLRRRGSWGTRRDEYDRILTGTSDDWSYVRLYERGQRAQITTRNMPAIKQVLNALARAVWTQATTFEYARDPLTRQRLDEFLAQLTSLDDDTFKLLAIVAEVPGRWQSPAIDVSNTGQVRVEQLVADLREQYWFAQDSKLVRSAKVAFTEEVSGRSYRVELLFPLADASDNSLVLEISRQTWNARARQAFEDMMLSELGVEVHTRVATGERLVASRRRKNKGKPKKIRGEHYDELLVRPVHEPSGWQRRILRDWSEGDEALVTLDECCVFSCGDSRIPSRARPSGSERCHAQVVLPFHRYRLDPMAQEDGAEFTCDSGAHTWEMKRFKLPLVHRMDAQLDLKAAWTRIIKTVQRQNASFKVHAQGVLRRQRRKGDEYVVFVPVSEKQFAKIGFARSFKVCWILAPADRTSDYLGRAVTFGEFLVDGHAAVKRAHDLGLLPPRGLDEDEDVAQPRARQLGHVDTHIIQPGEQGGFAVGETVVQKEVGRLCLFLALLQRARELEQEVWEAERKDKALTPARRRHHTVKELAGLTDGRVTPAQIHQWAKRVRDALTEAFPLDQNAGLGALPIGGKKGYRLGEEWTIQGFNLDHELSLLDDTRP